MLRLMRVIERLSASERRLLAITSVVVVAAILYLGTLRALDHIDELDATILSLQQELRIDTELAEQADPINRAFAEMASQHSSKWTQEEIHDRLRIEITRLALRDVPQEGAPIPAGGSVATSLVEIKSLPSGTLATSGEGYRSYQIAFKTEPTSIQNIAVFLERLQQSNQALRIDSLELVRQPLSPAVTANLRVTRTVIDDDPGVGEIVEAAQRMNLARNESFETWNPDQLTLPDWEQQGCTVTEHRAQATDGTICLRAENNGTETGVVYQQQELDAGVAYDLYLDAYAWGPAAIRVVNAADGSPFEGEQTVVPDGSPYRYHVRFRVPGDPGTKVSLRAPYIAVQGTGTVVLVDNVQLVEAGA